MRLTALSPLALGLALGGLALSCSAGATPPGEPGKIPDFASYKETGVGKMLEARCGTLDCHGSIVRPLRIYSTNGLRKAITDDGQRAKGATTAEEEADNYLSVIGLEPELMATAFATKKFDNVQLLLKPLGIEKGIRHKGGAIFDASQDDDGWQCLLGWVVAGADPDEGATKAQCEKGAALR